MESDNSHHAIERMIRHSEEYMRKQIEEELSIDGIQKRLYQLTDVLYLGVIVVTPFVCMYGLEGTISPQREQEQRVLPVLERHEKYTNELSKVIYPAVYGKERAFTAQHR